MHPRHPSRKPLAGTYDEINKSRPLAAAYERDPMFTTLVTIPRKPRGETLGSLITTRRGEKTLRELAAEIEIPYQTLWKLEKGQMPRPRTFLKLLWWLDVIDDTTAERLMDYDTEEKRK